MDMTEIMAGGTVVLDPAYCARGGEPSLCCPALRRFNLAELERRAAAS